MDEIGKKAVMLLEKLNIPMDVIEQVKSSLEKGGAAKVEVEIETSGKKDMMSPEEVDALSPEEAKSAFKEHLAKCMAKKEEKSSPILDRMKGGY